MLATPQPSFLSLPKRSTKPRQSGLTHVVDRGCTASVTRNVLKQAESLIDIWKFGWGISYVDTDTRSKVAHLKAAGVQTCTGGTLLEIAWLQGKAEEFFEFAADIQFDSVEVSNGACEMPLDEKRSLITRARSLGFQVLAEIGHKDPDRSMSVEQWLESVESDVSAGATWLVAEGRESGTVGIYQADGSVRCQLIEALSSCEHANRFIYETPKRSQQVFMLKQLGSSVNLGNIQLEDVLALETLRLGLRADTIATLPTRG